MLKSVLVCIAGRTQDLSFQLYILNVVASIYVFLPLQQLSEHDQGVTTGPWVGTIALKPGAPSGTDRSQEARIRK